MYVSINHLDSHYSKIQGLLKNLCWGKKTGLKNKGGVFMELPRLKIIVSLSFLVGLLFTCPYVFYPTSGTFRV